MLDCSRNAVMKAGQIKQWLEKLVLLGYNMAMLYTEDTFALPDEPYFGYLRGPYSAEEIRDIDRHALALAMELMAIWSIANVMNIPTPMNNRPKG